MNDRTPQVDSDSQAAAVQTVATSGGFAAAAVLADADWSCEWMED